MKPKKRITLEDVARDANVSRSTAALVLREGNLITPDTKQKVIDSALKLGYVNKSTPFQKRADKNAEVIGVCFPDIGNIFFTSIFIGVNDFFDQYHNYTLFFGSHFDSLGKQRRFIKNLMQYKVAGLILAPAEGTSKEEIEELQQAGIPLVFVTRTIEGIDANYVAGDNVQGAFSATKHLVAMNHKRIALLGGKAGISPFKERLSGYRKALEMSGLPYDESLVMSGTPTSIWGHRAIKEILKLPAPPTAVICYNDIIAEGVINALQEMNIDPGKDFSVVKFDFTLGGRVNDEEQPSSVEFNSAYYYYRNLYQYRNVFQPFTNVRSDIYQWGYEAAKLLFRNIVGLCTETERIIYTQSLLVHDSPSHTSQISTDN